MLSCKLQHVLTEKDFKLILSIKCCAKELNEYLEDAINLYKLQQPNAQNDELTVNVQFFAKEIQKDIETLFKNICESYKCIP